VGLNTQNSFFKINIPILSTFSQYSLTANHPKIIGINLFEIIQTIYSNKEKSMYLNELCQIVGREYKDVKVDVMYLSSSEYAQSDFIEDTINQRVAFLTPKSMSIMDSTTPPKNYEEFINMFENPEKVSESPTISDKKSKFKKAFRLWK
jgi:hypothetical protein